jgi:hypothetical protein
MLCAGHYLTTDRTLWIKKDLIEFFPTFTGDVNAEWSMGRRRKSGLRYRLRISSPNSDRRETGPRASVVVDASSATDVVTLEARDAAPGDDGRKHDDVDVDVSHCDADGACDDVAADGRNYAAATTRRISPSGSSYISVN